MKIRKLLLLLLVIVLFFVWYHYRYPHIQHLINIKGSGNSVIVVQ